MKIWPLVLSTVIASLIHFSIIKCSNKNHLPTPAFQIIPDDILECITVHLFNDMVAPYINKSKVTYQDLIDFSKLSRKKENFFLTCKHFYNYRYLRPDKTIEVLKKLRVHPNLKLLFEPKKKLSPTSVYSRLREELGYHIFIDRCQRQTLIKNNNDTNFLALIADSTEQINSLLAKAHFIILSCRNGCFAVYTAIEYTLIKMHIIMKDGKQFPNASHFVERFPVILPFLESLLNSEYLILQVPSISNPEEDLAKYVHNRLTICPWILGEPNLFSLLTLKTQAKIINAKAEQTNSLKENSKAI